MLFSDKVSMNAQISFDEFNEFAAVVNLPLDILPGFRVTPELQYKDFGDYPLCNAFASKGELWSGMLRFQRSF